MFNFLYFMMDISYFSHQMVMLYCRKAPSDVTTCPQMTSMLGKLTFSPERKPSHLRRHCRLVHNLLQADKLALCYISHL